MLKLVARSLKNGFQDFEGSTVSAKILLQEQTLSDMLNEMLTAHAAHPAIRLVKTMTVRSNGPIVVEFELEA